VDSVLLKTGGQDSCLYLCRKMPKHYLGHAMSSSSLSCAAPDAGRASRSGRIQARERLTVMIDVVFEG
jgi:hypothetical protein